MKYTKISLIGFLLICSFIIQSGHAQSGSEIRYSFELELKDKFSWKVDNYLDDGIEVSQQATYFGKIIDDSIITFTVVENPSTSVNIFTFAEGDLSYMLSVFKMVVGSDEVSLEQNIGILQFLVMPTRYAINNTETKNYIHYYFKDVLGGEIATNGDVFDIIVKDIEDYLIHTTPVNIETWTLQINRQTGILEKMGVIANSEGSNFEINISKTKSGSTSSRFPADSTFVIISLMTITFMKRKFKLGS